MIDRMAAVRAEMMDARTVGLKVDIRGIMMVGLKDFAEVETMVCAMVGKLARNWEEGWE